MKIFGMKVFHWMLYTGVLCAWIQVNHVITWFFFLRKRCWRSIFGRVQGCVSLTGYVLRYFDEYWVVQR